MELNLRLAAIMLTSMMMHGESRAQNILYAAPGAAGTGSTPSDPAYLQDALNTARTDGDDTEIRLSTGSYIAISTFSYDAVGGDGKDVLVNGGWNVDFTQQTDVASLTTLDGGGANRVLAVLAADPSLDIAFGLRNIRVQNGFGNAISGAGIYAYAGNPTTHGILFLGAERCEFVDNHLTGSASGGAIYVNGDFNLSDCLFDGNESMGGSGGAIISSVPPDGNAGIDPVIERCVFRNNRNFGNQGSSIWTGVNLKVRDTEFHGMDGGASSGNGSCIWGNAGSALEIERCSFTDIRIEYWGSAIQSFDGDIDVSDCLFANNKAGLTNGYAVIAYYHNNSAVDRLVRVTNCTFVGNRSQTGVDFAGALHIRPNGNDHAEVYNCILNDNGSDPVYGESGTNLISHCALDAALYGFTATGPILSGTPGFVGGGDYHLAAGSIAIDAGDNALGWVGDNDLDGTVRILNGTIDLGCYEFNNAPTGTSIDNGTVSENLPPGTTVGLLSGIDPDLGDTFTYELFPGDGVNDADNGSFTIVGDGLVIDVSADFETQNAYAIHLRVTDSGGQQAEQSLVITVNDVNEAPTVTGSIADQYASIPLPFSFTLPSNIFVDVDFGDVITLSAQLVGGAPLPAWLDFDPGTGTFSGTPGTVGVLQIEVIATDLGLLSTSTMFQLTVDDVTGLLDPGAVGISLFPNPCSDLIELRIPTGMRIDGIEIIDLRGALVLRSGVPGPATTIELGALAAGTYTVHLVAPGHRYVTRIVKVR